MDQSTTYENRNFRKNGQMVIGNNSGSPRCRIQTWKITIWGRKKKKSRSPGIGKELTENFKNYREIKDTETEHNVEKERNSLNFLPGSQ